VLVGRWLVALLAVPGGMGALYLQRKAGVFDAGPHVSGALPLQQLAGGEAQPLLRMVLAWVPAGILAGCALGRAPRGRAAARLLVWGVASALLLLAAGAAADTAAVSDPLGPHLVPQLSRPGTWVAVAFLMLGAVLSLRLFRPRRAQAATAGASRG
jgi:hypothetical protein